MVIHTEWTPNLATLGFFPEEKVLSIGTARPLPAARGIPSIGPIA